jgi:large subunit ribosomal protein L18
MANNKNKKTQRIRRGKSTRMHIKRLNVPRLCVHRTSQHTYAQIISPCGGVVLVAAATTEKELKAELSYGGNIAAAQKVGATLALRAKNAGIDKVAFDRSGFKYHGRIKALADAAREAGITF